MEEVKRDMFLYVELFYNRKRMHSVLGYLSPVAYRRKNQGGEAVQKQEFSIQMTLRYPLTILQRSPVAQWSRH